MRAVIPPETRAQLVSWASANPAVVRLRLAGGIVGRGGASCDVELAVQILADAGEEDTAIYREQRNLWETVLSRLTRRVVSVSWWGSEELSEDFASASELGFESPARAARLASWHQRGWPKAG